jgi:hypothetical protein
MRISTIVASVLLASTSPALACDKFEYGSEGWLGKMPIARRAFAEGDAEESSMTGARIAGAGLAALALVAVAFRAFRRASVLARPVEFEPTDPGHERPELDWDVEDEEALPEALAMH